MISSLGITDIGEEGAHTSTPMTIKELLLLNDTLKKKEKKIDLRETDHYVTAVRRLERTLRLPDPNTGRKKAYVQN